MQICNLNVDVFDIVFTTVIVTVGSVLYMMSGHHGLVLEVMGATVLVMLTDLLEIYRNVKAQEPVKTGSKIPQSPDFPPSWHIVALVVEATAVVAQVVFGFTLFAGLLLLAVFGGRNILVHVWYYSGTVQENLATLLPTIALNALVVMMVISAPSDARHYWGVQGTDVVMWLLLMYPTGAVLSFAMLMYFGVSPMQADSEQLPVWEK